MTLKDFKKIYPFSISDLCHPTDERSEYALLRRYVEGEYCDRKKASELFDSRVSQLISKTEAKAEKIKSLDFSKFHKKRGILLK